MEKNTEKYINYVRERCKELGVILRIAKTKSVRFPVMNDDCQGYFYDVAYPPKLSVASDMTKSNFLTTFVHEASHMEQWADWREGKRSAWNLTIYKNKDNCDLYFEWLSGNKKFSKKEIRIITDRAARVELDCEIRAVKAIKKWQLPLNKKEYTQQGWAYILSYYVSAEVGKWFDAKTPYQCKEIIERMPKTFNHDPNVLWKKYKNLFIKHCYKK